jgi:phage terminase small subunit
MEDTASAFVDDDMKVPEIKEKIRSYRDEVPELQDVKLSQTKASLIEDATAAVEKHYQNQQGLGGDEMTMETSAADPAPSTAEDADGSDQESDQETAEEDVEDSAGENPSAFGRSSDTIGNAGNPLTP